MSDSIESQIKEIIADKLNKKIEEVASDSKLIEDLGADSLDTVELVMEFEEKFSIEVPDAEAEKLKTVQDVINYVEAHKA